MGRMLIPDRPTTDIFAAVLGAAEEVLAEDELLAVDDLDLVEDEDDGDHAQHHGQLRLVHDTKQQ